MSFGFASKKSDKNGVSVPPPLPRNTVSPIAKLQAVSPVTAPAPLTPRPPTVRTVDRAQPSMIGADVTIRGSLVTDGELMIDGEIQGDLRASHVIIGEKARVAGGVTGEEVVIRGHVIGSVHARKVMLQSSCHVEGDVHHQSFAIEHGAYFEGKSRRSDDPLAQAPKPISLAVKAGPSAA